MQRQSFVLLCPHLALLSGSSLGVLHAMPILARCCQQGALPEFHLAAGLLMSRSLDASSRVSIVSTDSISSSAGSFQLWGNPAVAPLASGNVAGSLPGAAAGWLQLADPEGRSFWLDSSTGRARWSMPGTV